MSEDYYEAIGRILNDSFSQNRDPFDAIKKEEINRKIRTDSQFPKQENIKSENVKNIHKTEKWQAMNTANYSKRNIRKPEFQRVKIPAIAVPKYLIEDFLTLKLPPGASFEECKASWKNLLKRYHPDLQDSSNAQDTQVIIRINNSFRRIEEWFASCEK